MGLILGKLTSLFQRKKSTLQELESIDKEIKSLEESRKDTESTRRRIVGRFVLFSVIVYVVVAFVFYFFFFPASFYDRLYYILPLIVAPVIIFVLKRVMAWYFNRKITRAQTKLSKLQDEKKKLLDTVMETETYKVAMQILEKFAPEQTKKTSSIVPLTPSADVLHNYSILEGIVSRIGLRHRTPNPKDSVPTPSLPTTTPLTLQVASKLNLPTVPTTPVMRPNISKSNTGTLQRPIGSFARPPQATPSIMSATMARLPPATPSLPTPKTILPRDRSIFDKMVDYLVGDGPSNRYALICQNCYSHNGMVLREEAKYTSFRCCYCFTFNPAIVKKLPAPKLELNKTITAEVRSTSESSTSSSTDSEDEFAKKMVKPELPRQSLDSSKNEKTVKDTDKQPVLGTFSDLERKFCEIESTIAEIKLAEQELPPMDMEVDDVPDESTLQGGESVANNFESSEETTKEPIETKEEARSPSPKED